MGQVGRGEKDGDLFAAIVGQKPVFDQSADVIELGDLDEDRRHGGRTAGDELKVAEGSDKGGASAVRILPTLAGFKTERGEKAR